MEISPNKMNLRASDLTKSVSQTIMYAWNMTSCQFEIMNRSHNWHKVA